MEEKEKMSAGQLYDANYNVDLEKEKHMYIKEMLL